MSKSFNVWETVFQKNPVSCLVTDTQFTIEKVNDAALNLLGYQSSAHLTGQHLSQVSEFNDLVADGEIDFHNPLHKVHELGFYHGSGYVIPMEVSLVHINGAKGENDHFIWCLFDLSYLKQTNEQLQSKLSSLEEADNAKTLFIANISHEIRSLVNSIAGFYQLINEESEGSKLPQGIDRYLRGIELCCDQLQSLTNSILDLTILQQGRFAIVQPIELELEQVVQSIHGLYRERAAKKSLWFTYEISPSLPKVIKADKRILIQILSNLIDNAIKFTRQGNAVKISVSQSNSDISFEVQDEGIGIEKAKFNHLFNFHEQDLNELIMDEQTAGLGLKLTKKLTELIGGQISLSSQPGKGSTFTLQLPLSVASKQKVEHINPLKKQIDFSADNRLLIVEDDEMNKEVYQAWFEEFDFDVIYTENGKSAIELAQTHCPNLIITDIHLPGVDGVAVISAIRSMKEHQHTPILVISASTLTEKRELAYQAGCNDYLAKPLDFNKLVVVLEKYLKITSPEQKAIKYFSGIRDMPVQTKKQLIKHYKTLTKTSIIKLEKLVEEITAIRAIFSDHDLIEIDFLDSIESAAFDGNETVLKELAQQAIALCER